jgi:methylation protein EvaC
MTKCIVCKCNIKSLFSLGLQPLANKYPLNSLEKANEFKSDLKVFFCNQCGYANIPCEIERNDFFEEYYYLSSVNKELCQHFDKLANYILEKNYNFVIDIGSNDGILLRPLKERGVKSLGIDPSENVSKIANDNGLKTLVGFFDKEMALQISENFGKADLITASSVFTHLEDPLSFFSNSKILLHSDGKILVEVEYLKNIISEIAFERFYFDRPHYYSLKSLSKMGANFGFYIEDVEFLDVHGGSIRVIFGQNSSNFNNNFVENIIKLEEIDLNDANIIAKFNQFNVACQNIKNSIISFKNKGYSIAGYGCPARFSTITNYANLSLDDIPYVIDDSPLKQGRFSPGMHIPIKPYKISEKTDVFLVFAYEYILSIKEKVGPLSVGYFRPVPFSEL